MKQKTSNIISTILATITNLLIITAILFYLVPQLLPQKFGAVSITTINATDRLKDSRTTINDNFTALNNGKIDNATSTLESLTSAPNLATIGTITTGTWNGTTITIANGGTSATSFTDNTLFYGNGTSAWTDVATGTAGQLLTLVSGQPAWTSASFDQSDDYHLTGDWNFVGTQYLDSLNASSTLILGGITSIFPSTQGASSTVWRNDGAGNQTSNFLDWELVDIVILGGASNYATSTIPAGFKDIRVIFYSQGLSVAQKMFLKFNGDTESPSNYHSSVSVNSAAPVGENSKQGITLTNTATTSPVYLDVLITNVTTLTKRINWTGSEGGVTSIPNLIVGGGVWNNTADDITDIVFHAAETGTLNTGTRVSTYGRR